MEIPLNSEIEQIISQHVQSGKYLSAGEVIRTAVLLLEERERLLRAGPFWHRRDQPVALPRWPGKVLGSLRRERIYAADD